MAASSRAAPSLGPLASAANASLEFDLLANQVTGAHQQPALPLAAELRSWLLAHLRAAGLDPEVLERAIVSLNFRTDRVATDRSRVVLFELSSSCTLRAESREFQATSGPNLVWYTQPAA